MNKKSNKLISILGILSFILGLLLISSPAYASVPSTLYSGDVTFNPINYYATQSTTSNPNYYNFTGLTSNTPVSIPGCEGRNTGYSTVNGQSCVGNYIGNTTTNSNTQNTNNSNTTVSKTTTNNSSTTSKTTATNTSNKNTVAEANTNNNCATTTVASTSDINPTYGSLTSNALLGSNTFLPSGLIQWIVLIIIILAIIFLWRYIHAENKYLSEPLKHA